MYLTELAEQLDGRTAVRVRPHEFCATNAEARWICHYRTQQRVGGLEQFVTPGGRTSGEVLPEV
ncbi:hypothetical protein [Kitasatospora sp. NPDC090091]|uniref:hypothetical protein n=1 Tax=Kitasatospora sp. NPDC090091 TaxID=3364081 RepID=UPI00381D2D99